VTRTAFDTSVVVPALLVAHDHHDRSVRAVRASLADPDGTVVPLPVLIEAYSVLTRLPAPWRLRPEVAALALRKTFAGTVAVSYLTDPWPVLYSLAASGLSGGVAHDAHIAACARAAGADVIATWNRKHFERLDLGGLELREP